MVKWNDIHYDEKVELHRYLINENINSEYDEQTDLSLD